MACDGKRTVPEIVRVLQQANLGQGIDDEIVRMALAKLRRSGLLLTDAGSGCLLLSAWVSLHQQCTMLFGPLWCCWPKSCLCVDRSGTVFARLGSNSTEGLTAADSRTFT
jgi:hypothetical protein